MQVHRGIYNVSRYSRGLSPDEHERFDNTPCLDCRHVLGDHEDGRGGHCDWFDAPSIPPLNPCVCEAFAFTRNVVAWSDESGPGVRFPPSGVVRDHGGL